MENLYDAYSKVVQGQNYFFVKKYLSFPEFNNVPNVLAGYGMHPDFDMACKIAMVTDQVVKDKLRLAAMGEPGQAPVVQMNSTVVGIQRKVR